MRNKYLIYLFVYLLYLCKKKIYLMCLITIDNTILWF